ncbi:hypothetical protein CRM22_007712 [Opisthorchis felineus]|uniref:Uncharacterized protein n=1 Tax=Opisthorchis felineus TaxID=147828 RepID=A0A4S2LEJ1_OPIFE|nr:hypothetical protein CRM22_007712 [Opisthorchis felineus]TGZ61946.1 hypothetical protein CRM22_007712 [Opisthorchis felineus]
MHTKVRSSNEDRNGSFLTKFLSTETLHNTGCPHYTSKNNTSKKIAQDVDVQKTKSQEKLWTGKNVSAQILSNRIQDDTHYSALESQGASPSRNSKKLLNRRRNVCENRITVGAYIRKISVTIRGGSSSEHRQIGFPG